MQKLHYPSKEESIRFESVYGGYNSLPPNMIEINQSEYIDLITRTVIEYSDHRQAFDKSTKNYCQCQLMVFNTGLGVMASMEVGNYKFYKFAPCHHEYKEISYDECKARGISHHGHCWHVTECTKCHVINSYDSSD